MPAKASSRALQDSRPPSLRSGDPASQRLLEGAGEGSQGLTAPGKRIDAFAAGEVMAEMRLVAEAAFQAYLRERQVSGAYQLFGPRNALVTNPVLG
ncbi:hypothetical protein D3C85_1746760 [compost metagenome]